VEFAHLGEQTLKNIARPVDVYAVTLAAYSSSVAQVVLAADDKKPLPLPDKPSIAVLPFQNMSGDPEQEYFADGIVEDIITALSRFKSLFVIARNSSFTFKGKPLEIKQIGRELGVQYLLEGSVRRIGEKVRITTQLIDAVSSGHVWADRFDGTLRDVFEMQDNVTASVVGAIAPRLVEAELGKLTHKPPENWSSYDFYLKGQSLLLQGSLGVDGEAAVQALAMFRKAVNHDPSYGRAHAKVAACIQQIRDLHGRAITDAERDEALSSGEKAIQLAGDDEVALSNLVYVFGMLAGDLERGAELADRALALNPNWSLAWNGRGLMSLLIGQHERALDAFGKAMRLNPLDKVAVPFSLFGSAGSCFLLGRYDDGAEWARKMLALQPNDIRGLFTLTANTYFSGRLAEAQAVAALIKRHHAHLRSFHLRQAYRVRPPADMEGSGASYRICWLARVSGHTRTPTRSHGTGASVARRAKRTHFRTYVNPSHQKYFALSEAQITLMLCSVLHPSGGRIAIVTDVGCGMRWPDQRARRALRCGRRRRVVLVPRCWHQAAGDEPVEIGRNMRQQRKPLPLGSSFVQNARPECPRGV
jgi:adenylate cyclase